MDDLVRSELNREVKYSYDMIAESLNTIKNMKEERKIKLNHRVDLEARMARFVDSITSQIRVVDADLSKISNSIKEQAKTIASNRTMIKFKEAICKLIFSIKIIICLFNEINSSKKWL